MFHLAQFDVVEFIKVAAAAGFVTVPFLVYWVMLNWNFNVGTVNYAKAFNIVGALFSTILYSYYAFSEPKANILLANLYWFYVPAVLCTVGYFALFFFFRSAVQQGKRTWVVPLAMLQYVAVLSIFAVLVSIVLKHKEFYLVGGKVRMDGKPLSNQRVDWSMKYLQSDGSQNTLPLFRRTDEEGRYLVSIEWEKLPKLNDDVLNPVLSIYRQDAHPYEERLDHHNHIPWNVDLIPKTNP